MRVVISQPMFFPWIGMFEQIRLADTYVHFDDVQYTSRSFVSRVQVKTAGGIKWLTVPVRHASRDQAIRHTEIDGSRDWRKQHLSLLAQSYARAPCRKEMLELVETVYAGDWRTIDELNRAGLAAVCGYFGLDRDRRFLCASDFAVETRKSERVLELVKKVGGDCYVTGHGARNYLDHARFENDGIRVEYMDYQKAPYPQLHGEFTPYVSVLDLIANVGRDGARWIRSGTVHWKELSHHE